MPCYDPRTGEDQQLGSFVRSFISDRPKSFKEGAPMPREPGTSELFDRLCELEGALNNVTALLCDVCGKLEGEDIFHNMKLDNPALMLWWKEHSAYDKQKGE